MQSPTIVFDHVNKVATMIPSGPATDPRLAELLAAQQKQVATGGTPPPRP